LDTLLILLLLLMTLFLVVFLAYLVHLLLKWNRLKQEEDRSINRSTPITPTRSKGKDVVKVAAPKYRLEPGGGYFMFDKGSEKGYRLLKSYLSMGCGGITITYFRPKRLKERLAPLGSEFIWLTREKVEDEETGPPIVAPTNLGFILQELEERLRGEKNIIYYDCLERCYKDNDTQRTNKFLKNLKKIAKENDAILLFSIEAAGTNRKTRDFLKNTFKQLGGKKKQ